MKLSDIYLNVIITKLVSYICIEINEAVHINLKLKILLFLSKFNIFY